MKCGREYNGAEIDQLRSRSPGEDESNPYEDTEISELPDWWRRAIQIFEEHDLRAYRPPRFEDETLKHEVIDRLESELEVNIWVVSHDAPHSKMWEVHVDEERVGQIRHHRSTNGYSVFEIDSDAFESMIRSNVN